MHGRETAGHDLARRLVLVGLGMTFFALAALMWPSQASAQQTSFCEEPGCRPLCVSGFDAASPPAHQNTPLRTLTAARTGAGDGTFAVTAQNPYAGASYNSPANKDRECAKPSGPPDVWDVKHWCTFHCEHRHYFVQPGGTPQPATAWVTATPDGSSHFLGWDGWDDDPDHPCFTPASLARERDVCALKVDADSTVTAIFGTEEEEDSTPPSPAPVIARTAIDGKSATFAITTPSDDETWLGGYEVFVGQGTSGPALRTRIRADAATFTVANLLCDTSYTFRIDAFDSQNTTSSNVGSGRTGACPKVAPNGYFHVKPPRRTKQKSAFFHWGAKRGGVELDRFQSKCKLDKQRWRKCSRVTGKTVRRLKPGWHTFRVRVGDAQGWDKTPAVWRWRVRR